MPSPRPWKIDDARIVDADGEPVDLLSLGNAELTVECVNACIGIDEPELEVPSAVAASRANAAARKRSRDRGPNDRPDY